MSSDQTGFSKMIVSFAIVTLLSFCSPASSFAYLPRVSRTHDAIIIDVDGRYSYQDKTLYGQITNPGFIPVPSFNPYPVKASPAGAVSVQWVWFYSYEYPNILTVGDLFVRQANNSACVWCWTSHHDCYTGIGKQKDHWRNLSQKECLAFYGSLEEK
ncbi:uncharacterized protein LOC124190823 [Daphnia pulex]|uniref:uncharacterized protein LOC124190823 n=1 Tax=Daphnia pulex TaxID=6669 RepID=UPI001EDF03A9|nr:uncharacterized protein LOC124190823 [Daphnia pulex]